MALKITKSIAKNFIIYTDGSSSMNGKMYSKGGIGVVFPSNLKLNVSQKTQDALFQLLPELKINKITNNLSELTAILKALTIVKNKLECDPETIVIKTDSMYAINSLTKWYSAWMKNDWKNSTGKPVLNKELIQEILEKFIIPYNSKIQFIHVRAHKTEPPKESLDYMNWRWNDLADKLSKTYLKD